MRQTLSLKTDQNYRLSFLMLENTNNANTKTTTRIYMTTSKRTLKI